MAGIKAADLAYARLRVPDLDAMEAFLAGFGMFRAARTADALFMRGTDPAHHILVAELGAPAFVGLAYQAACEDDLRSLARLPGASGVEGIDEPGGGKRVRLTEPNGFRIEVVHGIETVAAIPVNRQKLNMAEESHRRVGETMRPPQGPSQVKRIGHAVLGTPRLGETLRWFRETLGFLCSDDVYAGTPDNIIASFNRCDRGEVYVDHHVFFCFHHDSAGLNHLSYEVQDIDDVFIGHEHLRNLGTYEHMWGIGRHLLGSQVYDYWADPWGRVFEHWSDTDRLNAGDGANLVAAEKALSSQWGQPIPDKMLRRVLA